jgi:hypothetical protein
MAGVLMAKQCPTPKKEPYPTRAAIFRAIANGARGSSAYRCKAGHWHTTSQVRVKPKGRR